MKAAAAYLSKQSPLHLAIGAAVVLGVVYFLGRKVITEVVDAGAGLVSGNNAITKNQTNASGVKTDAYEGRGIVGTAGAAVNSASGGTLASVGESIGGWIYDMTHLDSRE